MEGHAGSAAVVGAVGISVSAKGRQMCLGMVCGRDVACAVASGARGCCNSRSEPAEERYEMPFKHDATPAREYLNLYNPNDDGAGVKTIVLGYSAWYAVYGFCNSCSVGPMVAGLERRGMG